MYVRTGFLTSGKRPVRLLRVTDVASVISSIVLMRRLLSVLIVVCLLAASGLWIYRSSLTRIRTVAYDLTDRLPFAARASEREVIMFGWPGAEPHAGPGMDGDPETRERERFLWVRQGASLKINIKEPRDRALIFDIEAYQGIERQRLAIRVNGVSLGEQEVPSPRGRVRFDWPGTAQRDANELALEFSKSITSTTGDTRDFAAALFSLTIGDPKDSTFDLLRERDTPRAFEVTAKEGVPSLTLPGTSQTSFAFRLPKNASLEFESGLAPWSAASGGKGSLQIAFDSTDGRTRESVQIPLGAQTLQPSKIALNGEEGTPFIVRMDVVSENPGLTFAQIRAPRILGDPPAGKPALPRDALKFAQALAGRKPNVLLVVLDAARALSFGAYGHSRKTTPNIDRLSSEGFTFDNAYTTAAYTLAAMSSVWTSQQPDRHHGDVAFSAKLPKDRLMLAEVLTAQGIHTAGFVANGVAGAFNGFDRGFKEFDEPWQKYGSQAAGFRNVMPAFLDRMKKDGTRFFAYVHYREPHEPYDPPPPFDTRFGPPSPIPHSHHDGSEAAKKWVKDINQGVIQPTADEIDHVRRLYDGNLAFADQEFGYLLWRTRVARPPRQHRGDRDRRSRRGPVRARATSVTTRRSSKRAPACRSSSPSQRPCAPRNPPARVRVARGSHRHRSHHSRHLRPGTERAARPAHSRDIRSFRTSRIRRSAAAVTLAKS